MSTKDQLRTRTLLHRPYTRIQNPTTKHFSLQNTDVDKTPLMLYTETTIGQPIRTILLKQMSNHRLAQWVSHQINKPITRTTIGSWRNGFGIVRKER